MKALDRKFCVAPMMQYTDMHDRFLLRLISKKVFLYTEMIATGSLIYGKCFDQLEFNKEEQRYILRLKEINRLAFLLREDGDQHVGSSDLSFARALHVEYRSLQNALETQSRLCINLCFA